MNASPALSTVIQKRADAHDTLVKGTVLSGCSTVGAPHPLPLKMTAWPLQLTATQKLPVGQESDVLYPPALPESATQPGAGAPAANAGAVTVGYMIRGSASPSTGAMNLDHWGVMCDLS